MRRRRLGHAFADEVIKVKTPTPRKGGEAHNFKDALFAHFDLDSSTRRVSAWRRMALLSLFLIIFSVVFFRLFALQAIEGSQMRDLADSNRIKVKVIHAPRGVIYDRNGKILAQNEPGFRLIESSSSGLPHTEYISRDEALKMEVDNDPRFKDLEIDSLRSYPLGESTAHILGYVGQINADELKSAKYSDYKLGDQIGRGGVEESYEKVLRGVDGGEIIEVDAAGKAIRTLRKTDPIPGQNLYLSIDSDLQKEVYKDLESGVKKAGSCCGAAVAEDPKTGQILALASYPSFDPKNLTPALLDPNSPLLDRVIGGTYPPGSTFKIASSLAGLSSGKITSDTSFTDTGVMYLGSFSFANWYFTEYGRKEDGPINVVRALQRSNDIYFYNLGQTIGEGQIASTAKKLGLGTILGIDIPGEVSGLIPDDKWKEDNIGQQWFPGDTLHMAIGQGYVLVTPLQILNLTSAIADNGKQFPPHLGLKITTPEGFPVRKFSFDQYSNSSFKQSDISLVKQGLEEVPKNGGTAWPFFSFSIPTAGKTGTAEYGDPNHTHAWYTSYAPANDPKIALTVLVEKAGEGSNDSAPIAKQIYTWYFSKDKNHLTNFDNIPIATESAKTLGE